MDGQKERQGDFVFTAMETGEYRFCFDNQMSTFAEKFVDFEIAVCLPLAPPAIYGCLWVWNGIGFRLWLLMGWMNRSRTNNATPKSPPSRAHPPNRPPRSKNRSSSSPVNSPPSHATKNTSVPARTATSAQ